MIVYLFVFIPFVTLIGIGGYMVYSALSGKGVPAPDKRALFQIQFGYKVRGFIGLLIIMVNLFAIWNILKV